MAKSPVRILIVDDEPELRSTISFELNQTGFITENAADGLEAQDLLLHKNFDIVISDVRMPRCGGVELLQWVMNKKFKNTAMIFMSGFADIPIWEAFGLGVQGFLGKPFDISDLQMQIRNLLLPLSERWLSSPPPFQNTFKANFDHSDGTPASGFALGQGGCFMAQFPPSWKQNQNIELSLEVPMLAGGKIEGVAHIRWIRRNPDNGNYLGAGLEFLTLTPECQVEVVDWIRRNEPTAFIPTN